MKALQPYLRQRLAAAWACLLGQSVMFNVVIDRVDSERQVVSVKPRTSMIGVWAINEVKKP